MATIVGVKELVTYFKQTGLNSELDPVTLKQEVPTRWNSKFVMLESYQRSADKVKEILLSKNRLDKIRNIDDATVGEIVEFLRPFAEATEALSADKRPTIHLVALWNEQLRKHLVAKDTDSDNMLAMKLEVLELFDIYCTIDDIYYIACALNPK